MFRKALFPRKVAPSCRSFSISPSQHRLPPNRSLLASLDVLDKLLSSPKPETSEVRAYTEQKLKDPRAYQSLRERSAVYEKLALILTRHRQVNEASWLVSRMEEEGLQPRPLTRARLMVAEVLQCPPEERESLFSSLKDLIQQESLKQDDLLALVDSFDWSVGKSYYVPARVIRDFIDCQKESFVPSAEVATLLVNMQTRAGLLDDAYVTLRDLRPTAAAQEASRPFASTISSLAAANPTDDVFFGKVMGLMQDKAVGGDADTFNALIERERALGDHERVLAFYDLLRQLHADGAVSPDGITFINVFTSMALAKKPGKFTPRHLFRDLYSFYFYSADRSPPIDTDMMDLDQDILDRALLAFLNTKDPAAALVSLRMYALLGLPVTTNTFRRIVNYVAAKIKFSGVLWRKPFLRELNYVPLNPDAVPQLLQPRGLDPKLVQLVLDSLRKRDGARYVVPSYGMMQGTAPSPNSARWDVIPLEDIMTLVIRTDLRVKLEKESDFTEEGLEEETRALVRQTQTSMMLGGVTLRNWGNGPRPRGVGERKKDYGRRSRKQGTCNSISLEREEVDKVFVCWKGSNVTVEACLFHRKVHHPVDGPSESLPGSPSIWLLDTVLVPLPSFLFILALPIALIYQRNRALPRTRARKWIDILRLTGFLLWAMVELLRLAAANMGVGLLPATPIGVMLALFVLVAGRKVGPTRVVSAVLTSYWFLLSIMVIIKCVRLHLLKKLNPTTPENSEYPSSDWFWDNLVLMVGAIGFFMEECSRLISSPRYDEVAKTETEDEKAKTEAA